MGTADLHMHSTWSDGREPISHILAHVAHATRLDVIAITDHDCIEGALHARDLAARRWSRIEIVIGAEISTREGHLLALGIEHLIPAGLSMAETIHHVHDQGGLAVVAHPLSRWCPSAARRVLEALANQPGDAPDGLETINGSFAGMGSNRRAGMLNRRRFGWAALGGSDAHTLAAIGSSFTYFPGHSTADLLAAIRERRTVACGGFWPTREFVRCLLTRERDAHSLTEAPAETFGDSIEVNAHPTA